ncbi:glycosyltransferase family 2 protein [Cupriavidus sp. WGtm5]|uniref:glycosyltransferase family 2 protein n=1 Tax=Cupriavidus sp. WGtm5 TaxID=2919926 RepID=UPI002090F3D3|nr:glycosyltransferase family 2 protein [Cupriavidus sp. WGtm5]MCO4888760.1 glycosyltransferase family 2 protein [Cupriavidus sp. WGtm5]
MTVEHLTSTNKPLVAVVIPTYKARAHILDVLARIGPEVDLVFVVDDACPEESGTYVELSVVDPRVQVVKHEVNRGVGGAVLTGYRAAIEHGADVVVKIDSDGQMDPSLIPQFVEPILTNQADYTKGNRFFDLEGVEQMPAIRLIGNAALSFLTKISSGYWDIFDPTNGYTAISSQALKLLPFSKISERYFFETDMLFRLNTARAVVLDIPMKAVYGDEVSNLKISKIIGEFFFKNCKNFLKRVFYNYYLRDMSAASIELPLGMVLLLFGLLFGGYHWQDSLVTGHPAATGTVVLSALNILMGFQMLLAFLAFDVASVPRRPRTNLPQAKSNQPHWRSE